VRIAEIRNNRGAARHQGGDLDGAISDQTQAIKLNPRLAIAWHDRGMTRQAKGDLDGALADYKRAVTLAAVNKGLRQAIEHRIEDVARLCAAKRQVHLSESFGHYLIQLSRRIEEERLHE
jgi:tetratricopeptide (TPR) repeat protein